METYTKEQVEKIIEREREYARYRTPFLYDALDVNTQVIEAKGRKMDELEKRIEELKAEIVRLRKVNPEPKPTLCDNAANKVRGMTAGAFSSLLVLIFIWVGLSIIGVTITAAGGTIPFVVGWFALPFFVAGLTVIMYVIYYPAAKFWGRNPFTQAAWQKSPLYKEPKEGS